MALLNFVNLGLATLGCFVLYELILAIYRVFFHPLSTFPGPKLAAATGWYEFYYEIIKPGSWLWEIERLHRVYGIPPFSYFSRQMLHRSLSF